MTIEEVPISSLVFDPANVRTHSPKNLEAIKASLARFGQQKPIVVDANNVVRAGNGTLAAAHSLGWQSIKIIRTGLAGSEATAFAIADNRTNELSQWDNEALASTLAALKEESDALLTAAGFDIGELATLLGNEIPASAAGTEYTEDVADEVELCTCPKCGNKFPA
jgi:ParB-like chromosome segregation protein Spo0J